MFPVASLQIFPLSNHAFSFSFLFLDNLKLFDICILWPSHCSHPPFLVKPTLEIPIRHIARYRYFLVKSSSTVTVGNYILITMTVVNDSSNRLLAWHQTAGYYPASSILLNLLLVLRLLLLRYNVDVAFPINI